MRGIIIGAAPGFDPELLKSHVRPEDYVICADGGYDYALRAGIVPNVFLGDMDSVHSQDISASRVIRLSPQKDDTDSYTAARVGLEAGCREFLLFAVTGGRLDHSLANLFLLDFLQAAGAWGRIVEPDIECELLRPFMTLCPRKGWFYSLIALSEEMVVSEKGCQYELDHATIRQNYQYGISNEFLDQEVALTLHSGKGLIILVKQSG